MDDFSPMMKQYMQIKEEYKDYVLFFRLGDFYEMFFEDAQLASSELELTLTGRGCGQEERAPMCGVPYHSCEGYISRLVSKGYKVAICEQMEDPATAKGLVKREVIRVVTPGTITESGMLDESKNNYLACIFVDAGAVGLCFADISTGEVHLTQQSRGKTWSKTVNELGRFMPKEALCNSGAAAIPEIDNFLKSRLNCMINLCPDECFSDEATIPFITEHFASSLAQLGLDASIAAAKALAVAVSYLEQTQKQELRTIDHFQFYSESQFARLDLATRRNLELSETMMTKEKKGSLLWVLDKTKTSMGKRLIRNTIEQPLMSIPLILDRQNAVGRLADDSIRQYELSDALTGIYDLERLMTKIVFKTANARDLRAVCATLQRVPAIKAQLEGLDTKMLREISEELDDFSDLTSLIDTAIVEEPPFSVRDGGVIKAGYHEQVDHLRDIIANGKNFVTDVENREREQTGIKNLKVRYNKVFGYFIEVTRSYLDQVPDHYIRKQTLANCERYITQELKELENTIITANDRILSLEYELFESLREQVAGQVHRISRAAAAIARLDVLLSFALAASKYHYVCPSVNQEGRIQIVQGRHPVVERLLDGAPFVPNDTILDMGENNVAVITGPNMAGKSTYMRQVALICLMAQVGSFVPAKSADLCVVDGIFTRVGASDDLASGQSTFLVEMNEVSSILKNATRSSLLILDEIGRGTSTFDGMSIARAVIEHVADRKKLGAKTLFATHYHELTELESLLPGVKNYNVAVKKRGDDITFLRRIVPGGADDSYGIEVAKLAGVPEPIIRRAKEILAELESDQGVVREKSGTPPEEKEDQISFSSLRHSELIDRLRQLDVNTLTPIEALTILYQLSAEAART